MYALHATLQKKAYETRCPCRLPLCAVRRTDKLCCIGILVPCAGDGATGGEQEGHKIGRDASTTRMIRRQSRTSQSKQALTRTLSQAFSCPQTRTHELCPAAWAWAAEASAVTATSAVPLHDVM